MPIDPLLTTVDYTSRDYYSLRADLIAKVRERVGSWTANNPSDFGVGLVEAMAYGMDILHYYLDRVANEAYLPTAVQRDSLFALSEMFGYAPYLGTASTVTLTFTNTTETEVVVPMWTRCQAQAVNSEGQSTIRFFETIQEITVPAKNPEEPVASNGVASCLAVEGRSYTREFLGVSNGMPSQKFLLGRRSVLPGSVKINVVLGDDSTQTGFSDTEWFETQSLDDPNVGPFQEAFQSMPQTDESVVIRFGDGVIGKIPILHSRVYASYRVGGGVIGNVPSGAINAIVEPVLVGVTVSNEETASGGRDPESPESIRNNASRSFRSRDRAVTLSDFLLLAKGLPSVVAAKADAYTGSSVRLCVIGTEEPGNPEPLPDNDTLVSIKQYLEERAMAGVTVQVTGPFWVKIYLSIDVVAAPGIANDLVERNCRDALARHYAHSTSAFKRTFSSSDISAALALVPGRIADTVTKISDRADGTRPPGVAPNSPLTPVSPFNAVGYVNPWDPEGSVQINVSGGLEVEGA